MHNHMSTNILHEKSFGLASANLQTSKVLVVATQDLHSFFILARANYLFAIWPEINKFHISFIEVL